MSGPAPARLSRLLTDAVVKGSGIDVAAHLHASAKLVPGWPALVYALLLAVLALPPLRGPLLRRLA